MAIVDSQTGWQFLMWDDTWRMYEIFDAVRYKARIVRVNDRHECHTIHIP
jgi:hypothetical protein